MTLSETASQTAGPYVHIGLIPHQAGFDIFADNFGSIMTTPDTKGERIVIEGRILDGLGQPIRDALIELWQANAAGRYAHPADTQDKPLDPAFRGWGRAGTDFETGLFRFDTVKPGPVAGRHADARHGDAPMAPHVSLYVVSRGLNLGLATRMYFPDEPTLNAADPVLRLVDPPIRRETLLATRSDRDGTPVYTFDIRLQGDRETVFLDI